MRRMHLALLAAFGFVLSTWAQPAPKIVGGPYTVNAGQRSATVMWVVETGQVSVGSAPDRMKTVPVLHAGRALLTVSVFRAKHLREWPPPGG